MNKTSTIQANDGTLTLVNVFSVRPENQDRLVRALLQATDQRMRHVDGFISANVLKSLDGERVTNFAQWRSREAFETMLKDPKAREHMQSIQEFASGEPHLYEVVDVVHI